MASVGISTGGKAFFGGLTAGTFGLGCWQVIRYNEKTEQIQQRRRELEMAPTSDFETKEFPYQRKQLTGTFFYDKEVLVGPRGAPLDPKAAGAGGMGPSPQGFMVLTPLQLLNGQLVWINRGWVPKAMVPGADPRGGRASQMASPQDVNNWDRPKGTVDVTAIRSKPERPKMIAIEHDYSKRPLQLFWMDGLALQAIAGQQEETTLLTEITAEITTTGENVTSSPSTRSGAHKYPRRPALETLAEFKTTPAIHAGYAATWYGLSVAGVYMTRKLITRGR